MPVTEPTADDLELVRDGAMTVNQCVEFSGISRRELFYLMKDGVLPWFRRGKNRMLPRKAVQEYLARLNAADRTEKAAARK